MSNVDVFSKLRWAPVFVSGFQQVSNESREYEDLMNIMTSGYLDASSAACFAYSRPRLMNNELLEKEVKVGWSGLVAPLQRSACPRHGLAAPSVQLHVGRWSQSCKQSFLLASGSRVTVHTALIRQLFPVQLVLMKRTSM